MSHPGGLQKTSYSTQVNIGLKMNCGLHEIVVITLDISKFIVGYPPVILGGVCKCITISNNMKENCFKSGTLSRKLISF